MIFNDIDFKNKFRILDIRRNLIPDIYHNNTPIPNFDGVVELGISLLSENIIEVDIEMKANTKQNKRALQRELAGQLFTREDKKLYLDDELDKYYLAKLDSGTLLEEIYLYSVTTLIFKCSYPFAFGEEKNQSFSNISNVIVEGTESTKPVFSYNIGTTTIGYLLLDNLDTGEYVRVNHNFKLGDKVIIDFNDKWKVRKNGIVIAEDVTIESNFFNLKVGTNRIKSNVNTNMSFIERWV